jgi:SHS family sialic acid transporter-like MFS transporter
VTPAAVSSPTLRRSGRLAVLAAAFLAWTFAGLEISLFILVHRQMSLELLGLDTPEPVVTRWFAWYQAAFLFGAATGGWLFGWLGDRIGRTRSMGVAILCYSLVTIGCYFSTSAGAMLVLRFIACLGVGGVWPNAVALVAEAWPDASRPLLAGLLGAAANVGFVLLGVVGYFFPVTPDAWRWMFLVAASPGVVGIGVLALVPESARWLASRAIERTGPRVESPLRDVFRPPLLSRTALGITLGAIPVIGSAANANWLVPWTDHASEQRASISGHVTKSPADPRSKAMTQITRSGGAVFGSLLGGVVASLLGRRLSYFLISAGAWAVSSYIFSALDPFHPQFQLFAFLLGFIGITYFGWLPLFLPELFPTRVRSTGTGISFNSGRVVAAVVILSVGYLAGRFAVDYARVGLWTGMVYAVGMGVIWLVPRGAGGKLED